MLPCSCRCAFPGLCTARRELVAAHASLLCPVCARMHAVARQHVIRMLVGLHVHRIVVVDFTGQAQSVVSIRDVLAALVEEPAGYFGSFFDD